jgi:hypothetical protein
MKKIALIFTIILSMFLIDNVYSQSKGICYPNRVRRPIAGGVKWSNKIQKQKMFKGYSKKSTFFKRKQRKPKYNFRVR